jgi:tyrosine-protein kinase Etk/Wzc
MQEEGRHIALFSGVSARAGTSLVAEHMASLLALAGARVLLVDADARRGSLSNRRNAATGLGLLDIVSGRCTFDHGVRTGAEGGFDFLPRGMVTDGAIACLSGNTVRELLASLHDRYDYVIVDSAPVLSAAETLVFAQQAGCVFVTAQSQSSTLADVAACLEAFESVGVRVTGALLNTGTSKANVDRTQKPAAGSPASVETAHGTGNTHGLSTAFAGNSFKLQRDSVRGSGTRRPSGQREA